MFLNWLGTLTNSGDLVGKLKRRDKAAVAESEAHSGCCAALPTSSAGGMEEKDIGPQSAKMRCLSQPYEAYFAGLARLQHSRTAPLPHQPRQLSC